MERDTTPTNIPESNAKRTLLKKTKTGHIHLGQGLIFVAPQTATNDFNAFLSKADLDPDVISLERIQPTDLGGAVYNSPQLNQTWERQVSNEFLSGQRVPEDFGSFVRAQSRKTIEKLFQIDPENIATMQVDNLMQALRSVQKIIPKLMAGRYASRIILPQKYKYSGHTDFATSCKETGGDMEVVDIPEIQIDGSQDLKTLKDTFQSLKNEGAVALFIDQEHNNNASGFDRDPKLNEPLALLLKEFSDTVVYFGDNAYKGLKESLLEPYPLMQCLIENEVTAFHYTSFSKIGNYRGTPSYKNILTATPGTLADKDMLESSITKIQRPEGIGATADGAILMRHLVDNPEFKAEVRALNLYLQYIRSSLHEALKGTDLANLFSKNTNGIFRCLPPEITAQINSGNEQIVTVGDRINIWPLGDPKTRDFFVKLLLKYR